MFTRETKMSDTEKAEFKKEIMTVTPLTVIPTKTTKKGDLSPKAIKVKKALDKIPSDWSGSKNKFITKLMEAVLDENLSVSGFVTGLPRLTGKEMRKFVAVVPEDNSNDHTYEMGKAIIIFQDYNDVGLKSSGSHGNHITPEDCRYATEAEIDDFLDKIQRNLKADDIAKYFQ